TRDSVHVIRTTFASSADQIRSGCYIYSDHVAQQRDVDNFWLGVTGLRRASLYRSVVNNYSRSSKRKRVKKLPFGTCKVSVHQTRLVQMVLGGIQELGGFEREAWLE